MELPPKIVSKKAAVDIEIGKEILSGFFATLLFARKGVHLFLEIGFDILLTDQFEILFRGEDDGVGYIVFPHAFRVNIPIQIWVIGIFGNNALRILHTQPPQRDPGLNGICLSWFDLLSSYRPYEGEKQKNQEEKRFAKGSEKIRCPCFQTIYKFLSALLIIPSTLSVGSWRKTASTVFSAPLRAKPRTSNADNASSLFVLPDSGETSSRS